MRGVPAIGGGAGRQRTIADRLLGELRRAGGHTAMPLGLQRAARSVRSERRRRAERQHWAEWSLPLATRATLAEKQPTEAACYVVYPQKRPVASPGSNPSADLSDSSAGNAPPCQHGAKAVVGAHSIHSGPGGTSAFPDGPVPLLPQLLRQREGQRGLHASRRALVHRRPLPRAAPPRVGRHGHARLHVRGGDSPELTRTRRGLLRARTGYACQPPAYCTYLRRRAACHQGRHCNALGYPPRAYGAYRGPWHRR